MGPLTVNGTVYNGVMPGFKAQLSDEQAAALLSHVRSQWGNAAPSITPGLRRALLSHPWPGNVRELRNGLERAVLLSDGPIRPDDLFHGGAGAAVVGGGNGGPLPFPATLDEIEKAAAFAMLERVDGNKSAAADALGISRSRLYRLLEGTDDVSE